MAFDPSQFKIVGHDFTETAAQRMMREYQEANGNATGSANLGLQTMQGPDGTLWQRTPDGRGGFQYKSPYINGKAAQMYQDPADGQWKPHVVTEESGGLIRGVWDTVTTDKQFMGFLAASGIAMGAAAAGGYTSMAGLGTEGSVGTFGATGAGALDAAAAASAGSWGGIGTAASEALGGLSASDLLGLGLAGAALAGGGAGGGGGGSGGEGSPPSLMEPTPPPPPKMFSSVQLGADFYKQNQLDNRNQTLLTEPGKILSHVFASGNTLLGS